MGGTDVSKVESECKDGPSVLDGAVVGVLRIHQDTVAFELTADRRVFSRLVSEAVGGVGGPIPVAIFCLVGDLRKRLLRLTVDLVVCNTPSGPIFPLGNVGAVARNPLCRSH